MDKVAVTVPGRICLFGEHQDYLNLPVITAAINLRVGITGHRNESGRIIIHLPDIDALEQITIKPRDNFYKYIKDRDYFRSTINVLLRKGLNLPNGIECTVKGTIPINSGTSSSSALTVAWCRFLWEMAENENSDLKNDPSEIANQAYLAEVEEFGEPGGMMDHYATAVGGVLYQEFTKKVMIEKFDTELGYFILGDSLEPKDTKRILKRVKLGVQDAIKLISDKYPDFDLYEFSTSDTDELLPLLNDEQKEVFEGALLNREITKIAYNMFSAKDFNHNEFGRLLNDHQEILDEKCNISTSKINHMLECAIRAGAYGGKINGSGGGGCMFCYAPENTERVKKAIENAGGKAYIVNVDDGLQVKKEFHIKRGD